MTFAGIIKAGLTVSKLFDLKVTGQLQFWAVPPGFQGVRNLLIVLVFSPTLREIKNLPIGRCEVYCVLNNDVNVERTRRF